MISTASLTRLPHAGFHSAATHWPKSPVRVFTALPLVTLAGCAVKNAGEEI